MIGIFAIYLLVAGVIIFFLWLRPATRGKALGSPAGRSLLKALAGALITWLVVAMVSGFLFYLFLRSLLIR